MPSAKAGLAPALAIQLGTAKQRDLASKEKLKIALQERDAARARQEDLQHLLNQLEYTNKALRSELQTQVRFDRSRWRVDASGTLRRTACHLVPTPLHHRSQQHQRPHHPKHPAIAQSAPRELCSARSTAKNPRQPPSSNAASAPCAPSSRPSRSCSPRCCSPVQRLLLHVTGAPKGAGCMRTHVRRIARIGKLPRSCSPKCLGASPRWASSWYRRRPPSLIRAQRLLQPSALQAAAAAAKTRAGAAALTRAAAAIAAAAAAPSLTSC